MTAAADEIGRALVEHRAELLRRARRLTRCSPAAQDLVQDLAARALSEAHTYQPGTNARAWLHTVLLSLHLTAIRRSRARRRLLAELGRLGWWVPAELLGRSRLGRGPRAALRQIPRAWARAVVLVDLGDATTSEAAARLGVPRGTIMSQVYRGRAALRARLLEVRAPRSSCT